MTNLKTANIGYNKYCGPAVLSILTGKSTDECARVISSINGNYNVTGVLLNDLLRACDKLGFDQKALPQFANVSLFRSLTFLARDVGVFIVTLEQHFVVVEVSTDGKIYFCDNHTKEPIPAASSARMMQKVVAVHKVIKRKEKVYKTVTKTVKQEIKISRQDLYEMLLFSGRIDPKAEVNIFFTVPSGADYSGMNIDIDEDNPINIIEEYTTTEEVEIKDDEHN